MWWVDRARRLSSIEDVNNIPYKLCGDDMVGIWPTNMINNYETLVRKCNGRFSKGKHYVSHFQKRYKGSKTLEAFGHFTEETFRVECMSRERVEIVRDNRVSLIKKNTVSA
jgi:hypothetical protein